MTLDFLRPLLTFRTAKRPPSGAMPSPQDLRELRQLNDPQLRWYLSQHGQEFMRIELRRRRGFRR